MAINFDGLGGGVSDIFGGLGSFDAAKGYKAQAKGYEEGARLSGINQELARQSAGIQMVQAERDIYRTMGTARAAIGGNNLALSGSALDVIRDSSREASLTKNLLARNAQIEDVAYEQEQASFLAQAAAARANASASKKSGIGGLVKGAIGIGAAIFSDEELKEDIRLVERRRDGVEIYTFRYKGQPTVFRGVMAAQVQKIYPEAVTVNDGRLQVDYAAIGVVPVVVRGGGRVA